MLVIVFIILLCVSSTPQDNVIKSFYSNGFVESEINFKDSVREGEAKFYYENGNLKEERTYLNGRVEGLVKIYSEKGTLREVYVIENGRREGPTNLFDENGNYLSDVIYEAGKLIRPVSAEYFTSVDYQPKKNASEGNGETNGTNSSKTADENMPPPEIDEEESNNDSTFFTTIEVIPEPVGGMEAIYRKLIYPSEAKIKGVVGVVKVQAFIDEYGEVIDAQVIEGIGSGCDDVARNAIYYARFKPGMQKGKHVKTAIVIPIEFKPPIDKK